MSPRPREPEDTLLARAYRELQIPGSDQCPDADALAALAVGETPTGEREGLADHVVSCRRCSESYRSGADSRAGVPTRAGARSWHPGWIAAAAIALVAAGGVIVFRSARREEALRGSGRETAGSVAPADGAALANPPAVFRWPPQPQAEGYRVKLFASNGDTVWEGDAGAVHRLEVPEAAKSRLRPGQSHFWTVEVQMPLETQRLGPFSFTLRP